MNPTNNPYAPPTQQKADCPNAPCSADKKLRIAAEDVAMKLPEDQIEDGIKWTVAYLNTLRNRSRALSQNA